MLVLSRQSGQTVMVGEEIFITIGRILTDSAHLKVYGPAALMKNISGSIMEKRANAATIQLARGDSLKLGTDITITLVDIRSDKARLRIDSPPQLPVHRKEVYDAISRENDGGG